MKIFGTSYSDCRPFVNVSNGNGGFDLYVLRSDRREANMGACAGDCFYKKICKSYNAH